MNNRKAFIGAIAATVLSALLLPIFFGEPAKIDGRKGGDSWRNWIFDFQTLITGLAAVGAATWTISVMEKTDRSQAIRHRELVELAQRGDIRRLQRAIEPQLEELETVQHSLLALQLDPALFEGGPGDPKYRMITSVARDYLTAVKRVRDILDRPQFIDGSELFDGRLTHSLREMFDNSNYLLAQLQEHLNADSWENANFSHDYEVRFDDSVDYFIESLQSFTIQLRSVVVRLHDTKARHGL